MWMENGKAVTWLETISEAAFPMALAEATTTTTTTTTKGGEGGRNGNGGASRRVRLIAAFRFFRLIAQCIGFSIYETLLPRFAPFNFVEGSEGDYFSWRSSSWRWRE